MPESAGALPLSGIRVLDATDLIGAPCGRLLADLGADVVALEPPGGARLRRASPVTARTTTPDGESLAFAYWAANKRSVVLDVAEEVNVEQLAALAELADVVLLEPSSAGAAGVDGLDVAGLDVAGQRLSWAPDSAVVVALSPYGLTGPLRGWRATDLTSAAMAGLLVQHGPPDGPPVVMPYRQLFPYAGITAASLVVAALRARDSGDGRGAFLDVAIHEILASANFVFHNYSNASHLDGRHAASRVEFGGVWSCRDGLIEYLVSAPRQWQSLRQLLGDPPGLDADELATPWGRVAAAARIEPIIAAAIAGLDRGDFVNRGQELGVPCTLVNTLGDFVDDPHSVSRGSFRPFPVGEVAAPAPGAAFRSREPMIDVPRRAPRLGELAPETLRQGWAQVTPARETAPLSSIRVLSFGTVISGGLTASTLADLGADVVKIESPARPDLIRGLTPPGAPTPEEPGGVTTSSGFESFNRGVRSLALDLTDPAAVELLLRLVREADVLIDNFSPRVMAKWGLDSERLARENPRLVQLSITGFGHGEGPRSHYVAYGATVCSFVGVTRAWGFSSPTHFDYVAHASASLGLLAALALRDRTGRGTVIDLAMVEAAGALLGPAVLDWTVNGHEPPAAGNRIAGAAWSGVVRCAGPDAWVAIEAESTGWAALADAVPTLDADPPATEEAWDEVDRIVGDWAASLTPLQAARLLQRAGVPAAPAQRSEDVYRDPQLRTRGAIVEVNHPDVGDVEFIAPVQRLVPGAAVAGRRAPRLGEHSEEIIAEWLRDARA